MSDDQGDATKRAVSLTRPQLATAHNDPLNDRPLDVMNSLLGDRVRAAALEVKGEGQHTYYVATADRFLQVTARLITDTQSTRVDVKATSYAAAGHLRVLTFCTDKPEHASLHLDFGQAKPITIEATGPEQAQALQVLRRRIERRWSAGCPRRRGRGERWLR